jgi:hypothetical protein
MVGVMPGWWWNALGFVLGTREESANERHAQNRHVVRKTKVISFQDPFPEPRRARATKPDQ